MATKSNTREQIKKSKIEAIENNINLVEVLHYYFRGQVLEMDLKDFCLRFNIYETERQFHNAIKKLVSKDVLKVKKLVNTENNVVIAKGIVYTYFGQEGKTTRYSVDTVVKNSYLNYIFQNRTSINKKISIEENVQNLARHSTFFATKRDVDSCYNMFKPYLSPQGETALGDALYIEEKRKVALKNVQKADMKERDVTYTQTLQTLRERDIYINRVELKEGEETFWRYKVFLLDTNSSFTLSNVASKIALVLNVMHEQLDHQHMSETVDFIICAKNQEIKKKLERNFVTPRKNRKPDVNIDKAINKSLGIKKTRVYMQYEFKRKNKSKSGKQMLYIMENIYNYPNKKLKTIRVNVENIDVGERHNAELKTKALIDKKEKEKKEKQRDMVIDILARNGLLREGLSDEQIKYIKNKIEV